MIDFKDTIDHILTDRDQAEQLHRDLGIALYRDAQQYPSRHPVGSHWATDEAWNILDAIKPNLIPGDVRAYLAGNIAGALVRIAKESKPQ